MVLTIFNAFLTALCLLGTWANAEQKRWCFWIWIFTNSCYGLMDGFIYNNWFRTLLFAVQTFVCIKGLITWKKIEESQSEEKCAGTHNKDGMLEMPKEEEWGYTINIPHLMKISHSISQNKGFWEKERNNGELLALCHSELSEALEELRDGNAPTKTYEISKKPCGFGVELADCVIRIMDICEYYKIDLEQIILDKMAYNNERPMKHGKAF